MQLLKGLLKTQKLYVIAFALLVIYVGLRTYFVNITHDEAYSFHNVKNFWYAEFLCTGNSHWLNSLAIKISLLFGCENTFGIRWFSLLSFFITCLFGLWFLKSISTTSVKLLAFCLLFLNPYLLDYFGLARGYAGGVMFQCLAFFFFFKGLTKENRVLLFASLAFSGMGAISNYSFVYFFMSFAVVYFYINYFKTGKSFIKNKHFYIDAIYTTAIAFLIIKALIFIVKCSGDVVGAGEPSFLSMFHVFSDGLFYNKFTLPKFLKYGFSLGVFILITLTCLYGIFKKQEHQNTLYFYVSVMLSIMLTTMVFNYFCFNLYYPFYRAAQLLFVPVFMVFVFFVNHKLSTFKITKSLTYVICFLLMINFFFSINFKYTFDFREQTDVEECFDKVQSLNPKHVGISPELWGAFVNYYYMCETKRYNFAGDKIETYRPKGTCLTKNKLAEFEYCILFPPYDLSYYKPSNVKLTAVYLSPTTKTLILKIN